MTNRLTGSVYRYRWVIFAILLTAYFFVYFQRMTVGIVGKSIVEEVGGDVGLLSAVYFWTYASMQIPSGLISDRFGPRKATFSFLFLASIGSLLTAAGGSFAAIVVGKAMIAAGMAVVYIPLMKIISVWFPKTDFSQLNGIVIAVGNVGAIAASAPLQFLANEMGWRGAFYLLGAITLILSLLCVILIRDHPKDKGLPGMEALAPKDYDEATDARIPVFKGLAMVFTSGRKFWPMALAYFAVFGSIMVFQGTWAKYYFNEAYGFGLMEAAFLVTIIGLGKILSTVVVGRLSSSGFIKSKKRVMFIGTAAYTATWAVICVFVSEINSYTFWAFVCAGFGFFGGFMTLSFTQVKEWFPVAISGTTVAAMNFFLFLGAALGTSLSSAIMGKTYEMGNFTLLWQVMLLLSVAATVLIALSRERRTPVVAGKD